MTSRIEFTFFVQFYGPLIVIVAQKINCSSMVAAVSTRHCNFLKVVLRNNSVVKTLSVGRKFGKNASSRLLCSFLMLSLQEDNF